MPVNVLIYARYSTDRQDEVSIEAQLEVCREYAEKQGWTIVEKFIDRAVSGTRYKTRLGIRDLEARVKRGGIDRILSVTLDRISRDLETSAGLHKRFKFWGAELHTVHDGRIDDLHLAMKAVLSQELIAQIRRRTRDGMRHAVRKGKAAGGLSYGYRPKLIYDEKGERIPGHREIVPEQAQVIIRIFTDYADGKSPQQIASDLNAEGINGPRGAHWRDTAIRGSRERGTGVLNNELYVGRIVWNRREFVKDPDTERRVARSNSHDDWVVQDVPNLRIVDDHLWTRVKARQLKANETFNRTKTNALNRHHRPTYLLSGLLQCGICGGPFAVSGANQRYSCTNRMKKLPIEHLDGERCPNASGIRRRELEERVLAAFPQSLFSVVTVEQVQKDVHKALREANGTSQKSQAPTRGRLDADIRGKMDQQRAILEQMTRRQAEGRTDLAMFDQMLDDLEAERMKLVTQRDALTDEPAKGAKASSQPVVISPSLLRVAISSLCTSIGSASGSDDVGKAVNLVRTMIQEVVISPAGHHKGVDLQIHGRLAAILASLEAWKAEEKRLGLEKQAEFVRLRSEGVLKTTEEKVAFMSRFQKELGERREEWGKIQVSVVAGAGFEPATFRL